MEQAWLGGLPEQRAPERSGGGAPRLRVPERRQAEWRAVSLDDLIAPDHRVRLVWRFVKGLDLAPLYHGIKALAGRPGHPPADPRLLLALWLYATVEGIGSARARARLCAEHLAFQWLCGGVGMNHKTLSDFRVGHGAVLERLLVDSFAALLETGVASLERVAQDGVRVRAAAGAASFRRHTTLQACQQRAQAEVARPRRELDADPGADPFPTRGKNAISFPGSQAGSTGIETGWFGTTTGVSSRGASRCASAATRTSVT